jgi:hypothetical protein
MLIELGSQSLSISKQWTQLQHLTSIIKGFANTSRSQRGFKTMPTSTIDGGGSRYDHQSKIKHKKIIEQTWQQFESPMTRFKKKPLKDRNQMLS